ncbi:hypothetical protein MZD04_gp165 [Pseudomonas phage Psa21]|uniref:Uncharacterized protein n=1 Tax=Pseudomonas phage Psa21 TaxID=2530023 RepID=A0A481W4V4_9CAUD|nr:hypothetical protein MZD04_gp165 [Pseudomonas phage Psa21]QBJ02692.1 hypothetical protein PSA21_165 [Pseudomonas phage Psa21]
MNNPKVTEITAIIKANLESATRMDVVIAELLREPDLRTVRDQFMEETGKSVHAQLNELINYQENQKQSLFQFSAVLFYLDQELAQGTKGEWRPIAKAQANMRVSIDAIRSLRQTFGLDLREAKLVIEAFNKGLFE